MGGDRLYRAYLVALVGSVLAAPGAYAAASSLSVLPLRGLVLDPWAPALAVGVSALLLVAAVVVGRVLGPVVGEPFRVRVAAGGPVPRRQSLRPRFLVSAAVVVAGFVVVGLVPAWALLLAGAAGPWALVVGASAGALLGVLASVCWLAGQSLTGRSAVVLVAGVAGVAGLVLLGTGAGLPRAVAAVAPAATVAGSLAAVPLLLDGLRGPVLLEQAGRWRAATTAGGAGDLSGAFAAYRPLPSRPPGRSALGRAGVGRARPLPLVLLRRDLVGLSRTPGRLVAALGGVVLAVVLSGAAVLLPGSSTWLALAGSAVWGYAALGSLGDGVRHAVEAMSAPTLYGLGDGHLLGLHLLLPVVVVLAAGAVGGLVTALTGGSLLLAAAGTAGLLLAVLLRVHDAARGPMPLALLTPTPTPLGDTSGIAVAIWQVDALLVATAVPTVVGLLVVTSGPTALVLYVPVALLVGLGVRRRLTR